MIRDLKISDLSTLEKNNVIPNLFNGPYRLIKSIENSKSELIGSFWVRVTTESTLVLRENLSRLTLARALDETFKFLHCRIPEELGIDDSFITLNEKEYDPYYVDYLKKHYNYKEITKALKVRKNNG